MWQWSDGRSQYSRRTAKREWQTGLTDAIKEKMVKMAGELSKSRKKRVPSASLAAEEAVAKYQEKSSHPVHLGDA